ncbi:MAG: MFS transporter [Caulobacterales bacterium 32-69-10]|nr:MAG: MFS transporter [Caulobacterales bacterium 32-69-10]
MLDVLKNRTYRHLFTAQVIALIGTGLLTVALGLLAYDLAGGQASAVLGTALAIKMVAYVGVAPIVGAYANRLPRRAFLVAMDLVRGGIALSLPFVNQIWQIYVLIFLLQSCSAAFTPMFQATIPDVLPEEKDYTRALSLSRLAYDTESLISPALAAALLTVISYHGLFAGTVVGFLGSAALVVSVQMPKQERSERKGGIYENTTRGMRIYLSTPRLKGLLALNLSVAAAGAMVIVNTVVMVRTVIGRSASDVGWALAAFGFGSMLAAIVLPRLLDKTADRTVMLAAAWALAAGLFVFSAFVNAPPSLLWPILLGFWFAFGIGYSAIETPAGRLLKRSASSADRPAVFAAQFALSHACWLISYPVAGWLGAQAGMRVALLALGAITVVGAVIGWRVWPKDDPDVVDHEHDDGSTHAHPFVIDDDHRRWPKSKTAPN